MSRGLRQFRAACHAWPKRRESLRIMWRHRGGRDLVAGRLGEFVRDLLRGRRGDWYAWAASFRAHQECQAAIAGEHRPGKKSD